MDKNIWRGRIYRLVYDGMEPDAERPKLLEESATQLVRHLEDPNGWRRESAQRLLVVHGDTSATGALRDMAPGSSSHLARIHALWTLDGLGVLDAATFSAGLKAADYHLHKTEDRKSDAKGNSGSVHVE